MLLFYQSNGRFVWKPRFVDNDIFIEELIFFGLDRYRKKRAVKFAAASEVKAEFILLPELSNKVERFLKNDQAGMGARFFGYASTIVGKPSLNFISRT